MSKKLGILAAIAVLSVGLMAVSYNSVFDYNETGQRTFSQTYMGNTKVIYEAGPFYYGNGRTTKVYNALRTSKTPESRACDYEQNDGFIVQYGDGGKGSICAQLDANLSMDEGVFKSLIAKFRNETGIRTKLLEPNYRALFTTTIYII